jgi:hypothetical protein
VPDCILCVLLSPDTNQTNKGCAKSAFVESGFNKQQPYRWFSMVHECKIISRCSGEELRDVKPNSKGYHNIKPI